MKSIIFFSAFIVSIFLINNFYEPKTEVQKEQESIEQLNNSALGLVSKTRITKNVVKEATVREEIYRVEQGVVTFRTSVHEYQPGKFTTMIEVKHHDLKGKMMYSRTAYSQSKSITIYRYGKNGVRNAHTGLVELIDFKNEPSDQCLRNRFELIDMPEACNATVRISKLSNTLRLKFSSYVAVLYDIKGKPFKRILATEPDFMNVVQRHIETIDKEANLAGELNEPRI